jgi:hypothetical protein
MTGIFDNTARLHKTPDRTSLSFSQAPCFAAQTCPLCNSPARWVALLEQGGELGRHVKQTITQTINKMLARAEALSDGCSVRGLATKHRLRGAARRFLSSADKMRAYRNALKSLGLCPECGRTKASPGYVLCANCRSQRARRRRMARRIGKKPCACGQPAVNILRGEYICSECWRIERGGPPRSDSE